MTRYNRFDLLSTWFVIFYHLTDFFFIVIVIEDQRHWLSQLWTF